MGHDLSTDRSIDLSIYIYLLYLSTLSIYLSTYLPTYLPIYLSIYRSVGRSVGLSVCLSVCLCVSGGLIKSCHQGTSRPQPSQDANSQLHTGVALIHCWVYWQLDKRSRNQPMFSSSR